MGQLAEVAKSWRSSEKIPLIARKLPGMLDDPVTTVRPDGGKTVHFPHSGKEMDKLRIKQHKQRRDAKLVAGGAAGGAAATEGARQVRKADRDQNSLRAPVGTTTARPQGPHLKPATAGGLRPARDTGRGVGRHLTRDPNSTPGHVTLRARTPSGKFVSHENDLKVFHPKYGMGPRMPRRSTLAHYTKEGDRASKEFVGKSSLGERKGMLGAYDLGSMQHHAGSRVGRRLPL